MAILDNSINPQQTVWHLVDEKWLTKWRRFVMGRGPRRYLPPGSYHCAVCFLILTDVLLCRTNRQ